MYQQIKNLTDAGVSPDEILYVNFEDERLLEIVSEDFNVILEIGLEMAGKDKKPYIFLDEVQNIDAWEKFARRLADMKYRVNITGSNSKMLSSEIASTLGGRRTRTWRYHCERCSNLEVVAKRDVIVNTKKCANRKYYSAAE